MKWKCSYVCCWTGLCREASGPHEAVKNQEACQQNLWWFHVCQVCTRQVTENFSNLQNNTKGLFKFLKTKLLYTLYEHMIHIGRYVSESRELSSSRSRRSLSKYWRHRHGARSLSKCGFVLFKIKHLETTDACLYCADILHLKSMWWKLCNCLCPVLLGVAMIQLIKVKN